MRAIQISVTIVQIREAFKVFTSSFHQTKEGLISLIKGTMDIGWHVVPCMFGFQVLVYF